MSGLSGEHWMAWIFGSGSVFLFAIGMLSRSPRSWPLYGWLSMSSAGFVFLSARFQYAATVVWMGATALCLAFLLQALRRPRIPGLRAWRGSVSAACVGIALGSVVLSGFRYHMNDSETPDQAYGLGALGVRMGREHGSAFLVLGLGFLFIVIGMGRLLRSRRKDAP